MAIIRSPSRVPDIPMMISGVIRSVRLVCATFRGIALVDGILGMKIAAVSPILFFPRSTPLCFEVVEFSPGDQAREDMHLALNSGSASLATDKVCGVRMRALRAARE